MWVHVLPTIQARTLTCHQLKQHQQHAHTNTAVKIYDDDFGRPSSVVVTLLHLQREVKRIRRIRKIDILGKTDQVLEGTEERACFHLALLSQANFRLHFPW